MSLDAWLRGARLAKAVGVAAFLIAFLAWWRWFGDPGPVVEVRDAPGVVAEVHEKAYLIHLDSGKRVRVFRTRPLEAGARIVLTATRYASGEESYMLPGQAAAAP